MQILQTLQNPDRLIIEVATPADAKVLAHIYSEVYEGEYPCPELFTESGMMEFLDFECSHAMTVKISCGAEVIGCVSCELKYRAAYLRGGMIAPAWQGKIGAGNLFRRLLSTFHQMFGETGIVDYFYAEKRTNSAKFRGILRDLGYAPYAILPRKDVFAGKRESEIVHVKYFCPERTGVLRMTWRAAKVASDILGYLIHPINTLIPPRSSPRSAPLVTFIEESNGDRHLHIKLGGGASLDALVCIASREVEKVVVQTNDSVDYQEVLEYFLAEIHSWGIEYVEVYAPADMPTCQAVLETLGFSPVGFLPHWYCLGMENPKDCVLYAINFHSNLPDRHPILTPEEEFMRLLIPEPVIKGDIKQTTIRITAEMIPPTITINQEHS